MMIVDKSDLEVVIREAVKEDKAEIISFTKNTWEWGDYIPSVLDQWLSDRDGVTLVADINGKPVGLLHVKFLPDNSAWFEGLRVNPLYRRRGIAYRLNQDALELMKRKGISVVRLVIESSNQPSINLATKLGFNKVSEWVSIEIKQSKISDEEIICVEEGNIDMIWNEVKKSEGCQLYSCILPVRWMWIKMSKEVLEIILSEKQWLKGLRCGDTLGLLTDMRYGTIISFTSARSKESLLRFLRGIKKIVKCHDEKVFEIQLPKGHYLIDELREMSSDVTSFLVFEKRL